jgi:hypothetical protein
LVFQTDTGETHARQNQNAEHRRIIRQFSAGFSPGETALLQEILTRFEFDPAQEATPAQAVVQQSRFNPNAGHGHGDGEDEDVAGLCPHCLHPPVPPLRDYLMWRER